MKKTRLIVLAVCALGFIGCGGGGGSDGDSTSAPNTNTYNLEKVFLTKSASALLKGGYSNGITGSLSVIYSDSGTGYVNGVATKNVKIDTSITLSNGYTSQNYEVSKRNSNGLSLESVAKDGTICSLISSVYTIPTKAMVGEKSPATLIHTCSDSTNRTLTWSLVDAGGGNAKLIQKAVITGASQSESQTTITIDASSNPIYYKTSTHIIANNITGTFEGAVN